MAAPPQVDDSLAQLTALVEQFYRMVWFGLFIYLPGMALFIIYLVASSE